MGTVQTHHSLVELHQLRAAAEDPGDAEGVEPLHLVQVQHRQGGVVGDGGADGTSPRPGSSGLCSNRESVGVDHSALPLTFLEQCLNIRN